MRCELVQISKRYGKVTANDGVSLTLQPGAIHGLLGENGAGKSTLAGILSGLVRRDAGAIVLDGQKAEIERPAEALAAGIGMLHQEPHDFPELTVLENFVAARPGPRWFAGKPRRAARARLSALAERFGFSFRADDRVGRLTFGERQALALLGLLSLGVRTLILDEPTTGISSQQRDALFAALKQLAADGCSILLVSHKLADVEALCDRVSILRRGKLVGEAELPTPTDRLVEMMFGPAAAHPALPPSTPSSAAAALRLEHVHCRRGRLEVALDELIVREGEIVGLCGLEGSGQALLLEVCAGLLPMRGHGRGRIAVGERELSGRSYREFLRAGVAYLPADRVREGLIAGFSIAEHVALRGRTGVFLRTRELSRTAEDVIARFRIRGEPQTRTEQLSGGNQQRTQLALLPPDLKLLLMEYPTRGLDIESAHWVWQQLVGRCGRGTAILFASYDLDEVMTYSTRVMVFSGGRVSPPIEAATLGLDRLGRMIGGQFDGDGPT